ncbi:hypothetical protein [Pseudomonas sp. PDM20]|uniref:hypothetical protein n=1 Tax=Pseudomonas sp. PDM20 TaxID=2769254 RepID=UPI0017818856|nr:hypothetical protein [Pseudomonas sp. PDM20]MBD9685062.1 hypothetical protein [Pseudomonas sp. PDM20]
MHKYSWRQTDCLLLDDDERWPAAPFILRPSEHSHLSACPAFFSELSQDLASTIPLPGPRLTNIQGRITHLFLDKRKSPSGLTDNWRTDEKLGRIVHPPNASIDRRKKEGR